MEICRQCEGTVLLQCGSKTEFECVTKWTMYTFAGVTVLLAMSVYQIIVSDKLPSSSTATPIIGQL